MSKAQELKPELLPCPMCGGTEILVKKRKTTMVECKACGLVVFNYQDGIERDAIAHWNTRSSASSEQQASQQEASRPSGISWDSGFLTVVYRGVDPGPEAMEIGAHPKVYAMSWSHAINDRDEAIEREHAR